MFLLALIIGWIIGGGWISGYCKALAAANPKIQKDKLWLFSTLGFCFAPFLAIYFLIVSPLSNLSFKAKKTKIKETKIRIAEAKKARIELKEIEDELEKSWEELEQHDTNKKQQFISAAKYLDNVIFKGKKT